MLVCMYVSMSFTRQEVLSLINCNIKSNRVQALMIEPFDIFIASAGLVVSLLIFIVNKSFATKNTLRVQSSANIQKR